MTIKTSKLKTTGRYCKTPNGEDSDYWQSKMAEAHLKTEPIRWHRCESLGFNTTPSRKASK